jgi:hypothetical protein
MRADGTDVRRLTQGGDAQTRTGRTDFRNRSAGFVLATLQAGR